MRCLILIWNTSTVNVTLSLGLNAKPALTFTDFSACSGFELNSRAALSATGTMSTSVTTPPMTFVFTRLKCDWLSRGARRELTRGLQADRGLAGRQRAEVGVVLEPPRDVREERGRQIVFEIGVHRRIRAVRICLVLRPEAGENLRVRATRRAIRAEVMAVHVGCELAARDLVAFTPERGTDGHVDRLAQAEADRFGGVQAHEHLVALEPARKERRLIGHVVGGAQRAVRARGARIGRVEARTERDVQGVPDVIIEPVAAVGGAEVERPAARDRADPGDDRIVQHVRRELREVAERVDLRPVAPLNEARAVHSAAPIAVARAFAIAPAAEAVKLRGALVVQREPEVRHRDDVLLEPVAPVV